MKVLNTNEMQSVSGAGFLSDASGAFFGGLGGLVDFFISGDKTTFSDAARGMAESVAGFIESGIGMAQNAVMGLINGIFGMFGTNKNPADNA